MHTGEVTIVARNIIRVSLEFFAANTAQFVEHIEIEIVARLLVKLCSAFFRLHILDNDQHKCNLPGAVVLP